MGHRTQDQSLTVARVFEKFYNFKGKSKIETKVANSIMNCRTEVLGGQIFECNECQALHYVYHSCRDRHCPSCQFTKKIKWIEDRKAELLPVQYFHLVFTIPEEIKELFYHNKRLSYDLLFKAVSETLKTVAKDKLTAELGFIMLLHTWGQKLQYHPHLHVIMMGGGLSLKENAWVSCKKNFFLSVRVLSRVFRGKLLSKLEEENFDKALLKKATYKDWVVYAKESFNGPESVIQYLGQYTHKIAISNNRILEITDKEVTFSYEDRSDNNKKNKLTLPGEEFIERFLDHVIPSKQVRIRFYGLLSHRNKKIKLDKARKLLKAKVTSPVKKETYKEVIERIFKRELNKCPNCNIGKLILIETILPNKILLQDTS